MPFEQLNSCDKHIAINVNIRIYVKYDNNTHDIDFKRLDVEPNQMVFMNNGQVHECFFLSENTVLYFVFQKRVFRNGRKESVFTGSFLPFFNSSI